MRALVVGGPQRALGGHPGGRVDRAVSGVAPEALDDLDEQARAEQGGVEVEELPPGVPVVEDA